MHRLFLWQPFTPTQNIPARQLVSKAVVRCLGETLRDAFEIGRISSGAFLEKIICILFFFSNHHFNSHVASIRCSDTCVKFVRSLILHLIETEFTLLLVVI